MSSAHLFPTSMDTLIHSIIIRVVSHKGCFTQKHVSQQKDGDAPPPLASQKRAGWCLDSQEDANSSRGELSYIGRRNNQTIFWINKRTRARVQGKDLRLTEIPGMKFVFHFWPHVPHRSCWLVQSTTGQFSSDK